MANYVIQILCKLSPQESNKKNGYLQSNTDWLFLLPGRQGQGSKISLVCDNVKNINKYLKKAEIKAREQLRIVQNQKQIISVRKISHKHKNKYLSCVQ